MLADFGIEDATTATFYLQEGTRVGRHKNMEGKLEVPPVFDCLQDIYGPVNDRTKKRYLSQKVFEKMFQINIQFFP